MCVERATTLLTLPADGKLETAWLEFFLLSETHKCVTIGGDPLKANAINIGCAASLRQFDILHRTNPERLADVGPGYCDPGDPGDAAAVAKGPEK